MSSINSSFDGAEIKVYKANDTFRLKIPEQWNNISDTMKYVHTHFTYEIFFVTKGRLTVVWEDFVRTFEESIIIIPPQLKHYTVPDSEGCFCLLFSVVKNGLENINENAITTMEITEDIAFYVRKLAEKNDIKTKTAAQDCKLLTVLLFNELSELVCKERSKVRPEQLASENISRIEGFINNNLSVRFTLEDVSKSVFLSTRQISRIIEKEYGKSFVELVTEKRLALAEILLKNTDKKISEIAAASFPENTNYFYTLFKKMHGMTPLNYRKQMRHICLTENTEAQV